MRISTLLKGMGFLGSLYLTYNVALMSNQRKLVFNPTREKADCPMLDNHIACPKEWEFEPDQFIRGCLFEPKSRQGQPYDLLVYLPGRSEDSSWLCQAANWISPHMGLLTFNYRGSGDSDGRPSEQEVVEDGCRIINQLSRLKNVRRIHLIGRSLGTGIAIQIQSLTSRAHSLVLITPYDSITEIAKKRFPLAPVSWLLKYRFDSINHCQFVEGKTLVLVAEHDDVVPLESTKNLMRNWPYPFKVAMAQGANHLNIPHLPAVWQEICQFIESTSEKTPGVQEQAMFKVFALNGTNT